MFPGFADQIVLAFGHDAGNVVVMFALHAKLAGIDDHLAPAGEPFEAEMQHRQARERSDRAALIVGQHMARGGREFLFREKARGELAQARPFVSVERVEQPRAFDERLPFGVGDLRTRREKRPLSLAERDIP